MKKGLFLAFEGGEGTGKSTQSRLLVEHLRAGGYDVVHTREPGGTPGAEAVRTLLLDPPGEGWGARAEALLFAAARADHVEKLIHPALDAGKIVVCDRFVGSSLAYQGGAGGLGRDAILDLHSFGSEGLIPDAMLIVSVPPAEAAQRLAARDGNDSDAIGGRDEAYHAAVAKHFELLAAQDNPSTIAIDGTGKPDAVQARILTAISPLLKDRQ
ncbi:dTMP kinase [Alteripontixanthobacter maritimus]|uniref:Thymidylate kinase n=1 Tax=Alteripontixanthobacter maritimus TaxID=2161824 RepID=A0A369Q4Y7_9SPHN|nr:dTMP kinase [Alteripontixanthobacter maritimus]RDC59961.1 dTMP kinase [Alteripontixanthobacter maritimus]